MAKIAAILSMLHEPAGVNSATRRFRNEPVLTWTLRRLGRATGLDGVGVLCWKDQAPAVAAQNAFAPAENVFAPAERGALPQMDAITAALRWSDGWRGGLLGTSQFDRGFHGPWAWELCKRMEADAVVLVDPSAGLVDARLIESLINTWRGRSELDLCFTPAAPGLGGALVSAGLLEKFAAGGSYPGVMLSYRPDKPRHDPLADPACAQCPIPLARTSHRFTLDSTVQIARISAATAHLNGQLIGADGMALLEAVQAQEQWDESPRETVVELTTERATKPIYSMPVDRARLDLGRAVELFGELARREDVRLILAGLGDPLLHEGVLQIIAAARGAGISAISVESDFVGVPAERIAGLAQSGVDIVSVHHPATCAAIYQMVMGVDGFAEAIRNMQLFVEKRTGRLPLLVPTFMKCRQNVSEMEAWYDHWLRTVGCAVIRSPSDYGGRIPVVAAAEMAGPKRRACQSLKKRLMVLSDGQIVSCEQDVTARQPLGRNVRQAWQTAQEMWRNHEAGNWAAHSECAACKQWHLP